MNKEQLVAVWQKYAEKQLDVMLNPNPTFIDILSTGVLENEKRFGLKLCPCRIRDGTSEGDKKNLCPCNFKDEAVWAEKGRCWCGLFVKKE